MKTNLLRASLIAVVAAAAAFAQNPDRLRANVPFDFSVNGVKVKAGEVSVARSTSSKDVLIVRTYGNAGIMVLTNDLRQQTPGRDARLVFHRYGDVYFLSEIWGPEASGAKLSESRRERELSAKGPVTTKAVALTLR